MSMKCEICEVIMGGHWQVSENPLRCEDCEHFEERISDTCFICDGYIDNSPQYYIIHGNMCIDCINDVNSAIKSRIKYRD